MQNQPLLFVILHVSRPGRLGGWHAQRSGRWHLRGAVPSEAQTATCSLSTSAADPGGAGLATVPMGDIAMVNNVNGLPLTADQEFEAGLTCNGAAATPRQPLPFSCPATEIRLRSGENPGAEHGER